MTTGVKIAIFLGILLAAFGLGYVIYKVKKPSGTPPPPPPPPVNMGNNNGGTVPPQDLIGKVVVASRGDVIVFRENGFSIYKTAQEGEWIGTVTAGPDAFGYYTIDNGTRKVRAYKTDIRIGG